MESGLIWIIVLFVVGMGFSLWALLAPDAWMHVDRLSWGWMFRGGRDAELSDSGRAWIRIRGVIGIIATLVACGMLLGLRAESIARVDAAERQQATEERLRAAAGLWGSTDLRIMLPAGGDIEPLTSEEIAATVVGFAPVTGAGSSPSYFKDLAAFRTVMDLVTDQSEIDEIHESTDLVIGTLSPCQVGTASVVSSDDDRVVVDLRYSATVMFNTQMSCMITWGRSVDLIPIDLGEPLDGRSVHLVDGTELVEITD
ncbi:hypothetical protein ACI3KS_13495 [Microbacterium sp. ZW T5_45]|uniref:hypothetical protein n=1 Tax=Microbacterium sp. ZW T5_45 TaxID=3378080 RepID=UPI0038518681